MNLNVWLWSKDIYEFKTHRIEVSAFKQADTDGTVKIIQNNSNLIQNAIISYHSNAVKRGQRRVPPSDWWLGMWQIAIWLFEDFWHLAGKRESAQMNINCLREREIRQKPEVENHRGRRQQRSWRRRAKRRNDEQKKWKDTWRIEHHNSQQNLLSTPPPQLSTKLSTSVVY